MCKPKVYISTNLQESISASSGSIAMQPKQKAVRGRNKSSKVTVVVVKDIDKGAPRGKHRKELQEANRFPDC